MRYSVQRYIAYVQDDLDSYETYRYKSVRMQL